MAAEHDLAAEQGLELARLARNPQMLLWARCGFSSVRLAAGDVSEAVRCGVRSRVELARALG